MHVLECGCQCQYTFFGLAHPVCNKYCAPTCMHELLKGVYEGNAILMVTQGQRLELPRHTLPFFKGLIERCWAQDPEQV